VAKRFKIGSRTTQKDTDFKKTQTILTSRLTAEKKSNSKDLLDGIMDKIS